ncbi:hypothetical protein V6N00_12990 [Tersicoccus sp. MR15.9]|uniref:hypothetical protein n=1 Tax=Tersicoccus mangrovi TaxID=3121635 RepID=UPI002FE66B02
MKTARKPTRSRRLTRAELDCHWSEDLAQNHTVDELEHLRGVSSALNEADRVRVLDLALDLKAVHSDQLLAA